jgi:hypothetical protein
MLKGGMMKFKALSKEEFALNSTWHGILSDSNSPYTWDVFKYRRMSDPWRIGDDWKFYQEIVIPAHTKLGRYLYGIENETVE